MERFADCTIQWRDTLAMENAIFSLDGSDDDRIFFCCRSFDAFKELLKDENGEDFRIIVWNFINKL